jgi:hypothetical protein
MCVSEQLGTYGSVPLQMFRIQAFENFTQAPKNAIVVVPESGTTMMFVKRPVQLISLFQSRTIRMPATALLGIPKSTLHDTKCDKDNPVIIPCV